jgi:hypothetical protein
LFVGLWLVPVGPAADPVDPLGDGHPAGEVADRAVGEPVEPDLRRPDSGVIVKGANVGLRQPKRAGHRLGDAKAQFSGLQPGQVDGCPGVGENSVAEGQQPSYSCAAQGDPAVGGEASVAFHVAFDDQTVAGDSFCDTIAYLGATQRDLAVDTRPIEPQSAFND